MKNFLYFILLISATFTGCDDTLNRPNRDPRCTDPYPDNNLNRLTFQNEDRRPIYLLVGSLTGGDQVNNSSARAEIPAGQMLSLPFSNKDFNHYYIYRDAARQQLVACLIIKNTQPNNVSLAPIPLTIDGNFSSSPLRISNLQSTVAIREITMPDWHNWNGETPSSGSRHQLNECISLTLRTTPYDDFRHAYFYQIHSDGTSYPFCQVIYRNTNTSKIQLALINIK